MSRFVDDSPLEEGVWSEPVSGAGSTLQAIDSVKLGGGGIKETEDQPHALAITIGENTSEQRKTGGRHKPRKSARHAGKTAKIAHSGGIMCGSCRLGRPHDRQPRLFDFL